MGSSLNPSPYVFEKLSHKDGKKYFFPTFHPFGTIDVKSAPKQILLRITALLVVNPKWVVA